MPYNPASGLFEGPEYTLTGPDGNVYAIDAARGVVAQTLPDGTTLQVTDSGIIAPNGDRLTLIHDASGRLTTVLAPDGTEVLYGYDAAGNLVSAATWDWDKPAVSATTRANRTCLTLAVSPWRPQR